MQATMPYRSGHRRTVTRWTSREWLARRRLVLLSALLSMVAVAPLGTLAQDANFPVDKCQSAPCHHGAICNDGAWLYTCSCVSGYTGTHCETDINECQSAPCHHGATCNDGVGLYTCSCVSGYTGAHCETDIDECQSAPCHHGAVCNDGVGFYTCSCVSGYTGTHCETGIDECASEPCSNNGSCMDGINGYVCNCPSRYRGKRCEIVPAPCPAGYDGDRCQIDINECHSNPCQNGANCIDEVARYACVCLPGYTGKHCQSDVDECLSIPCQNGANCTDGVAMYACFCPQGYTGKHCENELYCWHRQSSGVCKRTELTCGEANGIWEEMVACVPCSNQSRESRVELCNRTSSSTRLRTSQQQCTTTVTCCPANIDAGIQWQQTPASQFNYQPCPATDSSSQPVSPQGNVSSRFCSPIDSGGAKWEKANVTNCSSALQRPQTQTILNVAKRPVNVSTYEAVASDLSNGTEDGSSLTAFDIGTTAGILETITNVSRKAEQNDSAAADRNKRVGSFIFQTVSNVMDASEETIDDSESQSSARSRLLKVVDNFIEQVRLPLKRKGSSINFRTKNIAVHLQCLDVTAFSGAAVSLKQKSTNSLSDVEFETRNAAEGEDSATSMTLPSSLPLSQSSSSTCPGQQLSFGVFASTRLFGRNVKTKRTNSSTEQVNTMVLLSTIGQGCLTGLESSPVEFSFLLKKVGGISRCVFWDFSLNNGQGAWSDKGISDVSIADKLHTCRSTHLTHFAVLTDFSGSTSSSTALSVVTYIGCGLSIVGLTFTILSLLAFRTRHTQTQAKIIFNLCIALLAVLILFVAGAEETDKKDTCAAVAFLMHVFLLAAFFWMLMEGLKVYQQAITIFNKKELHFVSMMVISWGIPLFIASITAMVDFDAYRNDKICRLKTPSFTYALILPMALILAVNFVVFALLFKQIYSRGAQKGRMSERNDLIRKVKVSVGLASLLGLTWLFGLVMLGDAASVLQYIFTILVTLQGFFIFIFHCLLRPEVRSYLRRTLLGSQEDSMVDESTSMFTLTRLFRRRTTLRKRSSTTNPLFTGNSTAKEKSGRQSSTADSVTSQATLKMGSP